MTEAEIAGHVIASQMIHLSNQDPHNRQVSEHLAKALQNVQEAIRLIDDPLTQQSVFSAVETPYKPFEEVSHD